MIAQACIEILRKHPEELNVSDYGLSEIMLLYRIKTEIYKREYEKIEREMKRYA